MEQNQRQILARALLGQGAAGSAADKMKMYPVWQQQFAEGLTDKQFNEWLAQQQMQGQM